MSLYCCSVLLCTYHWWQTKVLPALAQTDNRLEPGLSGYVLGLDPPENTVDMFSQEGFKAWYTHYFSLCTEIKYFWLAFSPWWIWKISKEICFIEKKRYNQLNKKDFSRGIVIRWRENSLLDFHLSAKNIPLFWLGFLGLKWQWLRDSFSKLMFLPSRHTLPGGVKLEIQRGFWQWGAQRRCGEHIAAVSEGGR